MQLTNRKPEASVSQVGVEALSSHTGLHRHVKVLLVEIQNLVHFSQAEANTTLRTGERTTIDTVDFIAFIRYLVLF